VSVPGSPERLLGQCYGSNLTQSHHTASLGRPVFVRGSLANYGEIYI
jgi:hypothetical protein